MKDKNTTKNKILFLKSVIVLLIIGFIFSSIISIIDIFNLIDLELNEKIINILKVSSLLYLLSISWVLDLIKREKKRIIKQFIISKRIQ